MIEVIATTVFVFIVILLGIKTKKYLYIDEHTASIQNKLETFDKNFEALRDMKESSDYQLGSGHIY